MLEFNRENINSFVQLVGASLSPRAVTDGDIEILKTEITDFLQNTPGVPVWLVSDYNKKLLYIRVTQVASQYANKHILSVQLQINVANGTAKAAFTKTFEWNTDPSLPIKSPPMSWSDGIKEICNLVKANLPEQVFCYNKQEDVVQRIKWNDKKLKGKDKHWKEFIFHTTGYSSYSVSSHIDGDKRYLVAIPHLVNNNQRRFTFYLDKE